MKEIGELVDFNNEIVNKRIKKQVCHAFSDVKEDEEDLKDEEQLNIMLDHLDWLAYQVTQLDNLSIKRNPLRIVGEKLTRSASNASSSAVFNTKRKLNSRPSIASTKQNSVISTASVLKSRIISRQNESRLTNQYGNSDRPSSLINKSVQIKPKLKIADLSFIQSVCSFHNNFVPEKVKYNRN